MCSLDTPCDKDENCEQSHALVLDFVTNYISFTSPVTTPVCSVCFSDLFCLVLLLTHRVL